MKGFFNNRGYRSAFCIFMAALIIIAESFGTHRVFAAGGSAAQTAMQDTNSLTGWPRMQAISEESAVLMDADNGGIMYSLAGDTTRYPASVTKIMTCLLTIENTDLKDTVTMTDTGVQLAVSGSTNAATTVGEKFTVEQCLYMLMLKSANDIAMQLAEFVGGSVDNFAKMMNERADEIGCTGTHFTNPSGMPDSDHYTTALDIAKIMAECLKNDTFRKIIATTSYQVPATNKNPARNLENHCRLIDTGSEYYYEGCIGGKTGYTNAAGRTLVCAAEKDGRTLIGVTMRGVTKADFSDMGKLFDYGFDNFSKTDLDNGASSVNLPSGIGTESLERTGSGDKAKRTVYKYEDLVVGGTEASVGTASGSASGASAISRLGISGNSHTTACRVAFVLALILFGGVAFVLCVFARYRLHREKRRRNRR